MKKLALAALGALALGGPFANRVGAQAINNTTIPIVVVTLFTPGTVAVPVDLAVATVVTNESERLRRERTIISPVTGVAIPPEVARVAFGMLTDATPQVRAQMTQALSNSGVSQGVLNQLMTNLPSLLSNPTAGQLQNALSAFNGFVNNANAAFLVNPPAEFLALHAILLQISTAANRIPHP
jgi:hypothetical protein